jgi:hypothetical protein
MVMNPRAMKRMARMKNKLIPVIIFKINYRNLLFEIFIMLSQSRSNPNLEDSRLTEDKLVGSFVEDVIGLSLVVLSAFGLSRGTFFP